MKRLVVGLSVSVLALFGAVPAASAASDSSDTAVAKVAKVKKVKKDAFSTVFNAPSGGTVSTQRIDWD